MRKYIFILCGLVIGFSLSQLILAHAQENISADVSEPAIVDASSTKMSALTMDDILTNQNAELQTGVDNCQSQRAYLNNLLSRLEK